MPDQTIRRYDYMFKDIMHALQEDYVGAPEVGEEYEPKFYLTACGTAHHNNRMTDLLMLRYCSQMLATTFDRNLRFELQPSEDYTPGNRGFYARRLGEELIVTRVLEETRLRPGDVIERINDASPGRHRRGVQKNFFYATQPERELWNGLLKMADHILVRHPDGTTEDMELRDYPKAQRESRPELRLLDRRTVYLNPDLLDGSQALEDLLAAHEEDLSGCEKLILDLRQASGYDPTAMFPLLPWLFAGRRRAGDILPDEQLLTNYTQRNCEWKAYLLECAGDESGWPDRLRQRAGEGLVEETLCFWDDPEEMIQGRRNGKLVLLTDTWCEDAAEQLAETAQRLGAYTIGRPTMGTLDYSNPVTVLCDTDFAITWPMSKRKAVTQGQALKNKGLPVDEYVPFTAEEAVRDLLLQRALEF